MSQSDIPGYVNANPQDSDAGWEAWRQLENRSFGEKLGSAAGELKKGDNWINAGKGAAKFLYGLGAAPVHTVAGMVHNEIAHGADTLGYDDLAQRQASEATRSKAESVLAGQTVEEGLKGTVAKVAGPVQRAMRGAMYNRAEGDAENPQDEQMLREKFDQAVQRAGRMQQLAQGRPLDVKDMGMMGRFSVAGLARATEGGLEPSEAFSPEALQAQGAKPVNPTTVESIAAAADPTNLVLAEAGNFPGASKIAGTALKGVGAAGEAATSALSRGVQKVATSAGARLAAKLSVPAVVGDIAMTGGVHLGGAATAAAVGGATWLGSKLAQSGFTAMKEAGSEMLGATPPVGQGFFRSALKGSIGGAASTAVGMVPINVAESEGSPEEFAKSEVGAGVFGAALGAISGGANARSGQSRALAAQTVQSGEKAPFATAEQAAAHQAVMSQLPQGARDLINFTRGTFDGATTPDGKPIQVLAVDDATFQQQTGQSSRGVFFQEGPDAGTLLINAGATDPNGTFVPKSPEQLAETLAHEGKHAIDQAHAAAQPELYKNVFDALRQRFMLGGKPAPDFQNWIDGQIALHVDNLKQAGATPEQIAAKVAQLNADPNYWLNEASADIGQGLVTGQDLGHFMLPQSLAGKVWNAVKRVAAQKGIVLPSETGALGLPQAQQAALAIRQQLYAHGAETRARLDAQRNSLDTHMRTLQSRLDAIPPITRQMDVRTAQANATARAAIEAQIARWNRRISGQTDVATPETTAAPSGAPAAPAAASPRADAKAAAQARVDAAAALKTMGVDGAQAHAMINTANAQHGSPIVDASNLVNAVQRVRTGDVIQPGEYGGGKTGPVAQIPVGKEVVVPTGRTKITGHSPEPPKPGDLVITDKGEVRRYIGPSVDGRGINVSFSGTTSDRTPLYVANGKFTTLTHELLPTTSAEAAPPAPTPSPAEQESPARAVSLQWIATEVRPGVWQVIDQSGNPRSNNTFASQSAAEQSVRQTGRRIQLGTGPGGTPDTLNHIADMGGIAPKKNTQEYDDMPPGIPKAILGGTETPEDVAKGLYADHNIGDGTVSGMWAAVAKDINARERTRSAPATNPAEDAQKTVEAAFAKLPQELQDKLTRADWDKIPWTHEEITAVNAALGEHSPFRNYQPEPAEQAEPDWSIPDETTSHTETTEPPTTGGVQTIERDESHSDTTQPAPLREDQIGQIAASASQTFLSGNAVKPEGLNLGSKEGRAWKAANPGVTGRSAADHAKEQRKAIVKEVAQAHAQTVPLNYEGIRLRTDPFGKETITGTVDPSRPFDAFLIDQAKKAGRWNENTEGVLNELQNRIGQTVGYEYGHAPGDGDVTIQGGREAAQRAASAGDRARGAAEQQVETKHSVPLSVSFNPAEGSFTVFGASPEKLLSNFNHVAEAVTQLGREVPYRDIYDPRLVADIKAVIANHENGWKGDGSGPIKASSVPEMNVLPTEGYRPQFVIPKDRFDFLNMMLGDESAKSTRAGNPTPEAKPKLALAAENRTLITSEGETNDLRHEINEKLGVGDWGKKNAKGEPVESTWSAATIENPLSEAIAADLASNVRDADREDASIRAHGYAGDLGRFFDKGKTPDRTNTAAGFMPSEKSDARESDRTQQRERQRIATISDLEKNQKLTEDQKDSIASYQDGSYQEINRALREGWESELEDYQKTIIKDIEESMQSNALPHAATLFRSGIPAEAMKSLKPGDVISDKAFQSASFSDAHENIGDVHWGKTLAEIKVPAGTNGLLVSGGEKGYDTEKEFLLPRDTNLRFTGIKGKRFIFEIVNGDGAARPVKPAERQQAMRAQHMPSERQSPQERAKDRVAKRNGNFMPSEKGPVEDIKKAFEDAGKRTGINDFNIKVRYRNKRNPGDGVAIIADWPGEFGFATLEAWVHDDDGNWKVRIHDTTLPDRHRGKGFVTEVVKEISKMVKGGELVQNDLGVHIPQDIEGWRTIIRRGGMEPAFMPSERQSPQERAKDRVAKRNGNFMPSEDTGKPGESDQPLENLVREAEAAGIPINTTMLAGLMRRDPDVAAKIRQRIADKTGRPAQFLPVDRSAPAPQLRDDLKRRPNVRMMAQQRKREREAALAN